MHPAIRVENLSKKYLIATSGAGYRTFREGLVGAARAPWQWVRRLAGIGHDATLAAGEPSTIWALSDVSFQVEPGEVVGIIGRNGAGKSTLLKILSRITEPSHGRVAIRGRVGSLLEVGTGFHPELTGRENIYMNGSVLGMRRPEINRNFDAIVAFAEIERFLDTPVKRYSSGMLVRLAFAVAAHLDPEILIIDEVLAVGDAGFQKKCLGKMHDVSRGGRTVLFVSHNMAAVRALCSRAILLAHGRLERQGDVPDVVGSYHAAFEEPDANAMSWDYSEAPGNSALRLLRLRVSPLTGDVLDLESGVSIELSILCRRPLPNLDATVELRTLDDVIVLHDGAPVNDEYDCPAGCYDVRFEIPGPLLNCGRYRICFIFGQNRSYVVLNLADVMTFEIAHNANRTVKPRPGIVRPQLGFQAQYIGDSPTEDVHSMIVSPRIVPCIAE
ncbi:MAG TPA: ABC transporter ATP-binding protein [Pirellulales bacterium]|nr:ABC transporter ATP-binding protein [Pirellulales bacterium]